MQAIHSSDAIKRAQRRWVLALVAGIVLLLLYAGALTWVTRRLQVDVQKSIHPAPAVLEARRPGG